ncbi:MAG TPA: hypothetical protein VNZ26_06555 [Vicinamibacterales bacterium]|jgi:hypothetical protein|nr:hypothetical protein [Vicinamibacterales bacterium]
MMGQLGTTFGVGTPLSYPIPQPWGQSPYANAGYGQQAYGPQPFGPPAFAQPYAQGILTPSIGGNPFAGAQPLQQIAQLLQVVPQQLQQLQMLHQQQLGHLQQLLQIVPAQLQQLQQLIQIVPQQVQHLQQQPFSSPQLPGSLGFGLTPQAFAGQSAGHVM